MNGKLIVVDGLDGSGKSTQQEALVNALIQSGRQVQGISFPDYKSPSSTLIRMYLKGDFGQSPADVNAYAASSFYAADRYASYKQHWGKAYHEGTDTVAARYTSSNIFHQMCKLPSVEWEPFITWVLDFEYAKMEIPKPDIVFFLDMPPEVARDLISFRYGGDESKRDIHEKDFAYLMHCRECALYAAAKLQYKIINCAEDGRPRAIGDIGREILQILGDELF